MDRPDTLESQEDIEQLVVQRLLQYALEGRPDTPMPLVFLNQVLNLDGFSGNLPLRDELSSEQIDVIQRSALHWLFVQRQPLTGATGELYTITGATIEHAVLSVNPAQRTAIQQLLRDGERNGASLIPRTLDEIYSLFTPTLYFSVRDIKPDFSPDHLALLSLHGLFWLQNALSSQESGRALQLFTALWLLVRHEALAADELLPYLAQVFIQVERDGLDGRDPFAAEFFAMLGAAMAESGEPRLKSWIELAFSYCEGVIPKLQLEEQPEAIRTLKVARLRAGTLSE